MVPTTPNTDPGGPANDVVAHPEPPAPAQAGVVPGLGGVPLQHRRAGNHQRWSLGDRIGGSHALSLDPPLDWKVKWALHVCGPDLAPPTTDSSPRPQPTIP